PAITGPAAPMDPPFAATPLTVSKSRAVLYSHNTWPSELERARNTPSQPPEKMTLRAAVSGPSCPACVEDAATGASGVNHFFSPSLRRTDAMPPGPNPKYAFSPSAAPPHTIFPPNSFVFDTSAVFHNTAPLLSGSCAQTMPLFCP